MESSHLFSVDFFLPWEDQVSPQVYIQLLEGGHLSTKPMCSTKRLREHDSRADNTGLPWWDTDSWRIKRASGWAMPRRHTSLPPAQWGPLAMKDPCACGGLTGACAENWHWLEHLTSHLGELSSKCWISYSNLISCLIPYSSWVCTYTSFCFSVPCFGPLVQLVLQEHHLFYDYSCILWLKCILHLKLWLASLTFTCTDGI